MSATMGGPGGPTAVRFASDHLQKRHPHRQTQKGQTLFHRALISKPSPGDIMQFNCLCMQQLESRTLLAAGFVDYSYTPPFNGEYYVDYPPDIIRPQVDGKTIHFGGVGPYGEKLWRQNPSGSLDTSFVENGSVILDNAADLHFQHVGKSVLALR